MHSITVLTQTSFVIMVIIICFILSAWYTTEQNKKMLTSFNASTGSLGATLCAAS
ncbi:hypothetical protein ACHAXH_003417, partial [Discostella pseudostelligera]